MKVKYMYTMLSPQGQDDHTETLSTQLINKFLCVKNINLPGTM